MSLRTFKVKGFVYTYWQHRSCERRQHQSWRQRNPGRMAELSHRYQTKDEEQRKREAARVLARKKVPLQPCQECGSTVGVHRHHQDYDKPLDVEFLCALHHAERHAELRASGQLSLAV